MLMHTKRHVRITLDVECYSDFHPEDLDWNDILDLEGDEHVDVRKPMHGAVHMACDMHLIISLTPQLPSRHTLKTRNSQ